ncbi:MAG: sigma-70 family RNA polymerase sigma factor [Bacteroidia bacterium]|nr:sigma-70 family RNA polymerase sigma factor [Bacteroidia bacterium]
MVKTPSEREYWQIIWDKFKSGDQKAFEIIYNEYVDVLYAYGSKITSDKSLVEDSIQDLFIDIYTYNIGLRKPESLEFYFFKTLKRIIIRKIKEKNRFSYPEHLLEQFDLCFHFEKEEKEPLEEQLLLLQKELQQLDSKKRELIFLKFNSGLTYVEIGKLLELKPDTVKKQVARLLQFIRKNLGEEYLELFVLCFKT